MTVSTIKYDNIYGTASDLSLRNITLQQGQIAVETDTNKRKIGNGVNDYQTLSYLSVIDMDNVRKSVIDNPLVHILKDNDLVNTLTGSLSWNRSSTATYTDIYGVVRTAGLDEPRQEKDGWLIEGESTNIALYSEDFTQWFSVGADGTINFGFPAPDGSNNASQVTCNTANGVAIGEAVAGNSGSSYTFSIYARRISGTGSIRAKVGQNQTIDFDQSITSEWKRLTATNTGNDIVARACIVMEDIGDVIEVWAGQLEELPFATSYIPTTTTAVTRSSDQVNFDYNYNITNPDDSFSIVLSTKYKGSLTGTFPRLINVNGETTRYLGFQQSANKLRGLVGVGLNSSEDISTEKVTAALISNSVNFSVFYNDVENTASVGSVSGVSSGISLGSSGGVSNFYFGHISDFRIYNLVLNVDEIKFLGQQ